MIELLGLNAHGRYGMLLNEFEEILCSRTARHIVSKLFNECLFFSAIIKQRPLFVCLSVPVSE